MLFAVLGSSTTAHAQNEAAEPQAEPAAEESSETAAPRSAFSAAPPKTLFELLDMVKHGLEIEREENIRRE